MKSRLTFPIFVLLDKRLHRNFLVNTELSSDTSAYSLQFSSTNDMVIFENKKTGKTYKEKMTKLSRPPCRDITTPNPVNPTYHVFTRFDSGGFRVLTFSELVEEGKLKIRMIRTGKSEKEGTRKLTDRIAFEITTDDGIETVDSAGAKIPPSTGFRRR